jgi:hypothetical protein
MVVENIFPTMPNILGGIGQFASGLAIGLVVLLVFLPIGFFIWLSSYKTIVTVKNITGGKLVITQDKAKKVKDRKGVQKYKLLKTPRFFSGDRIAIPPDEVVGTTKKGKYYFEVYRTQSGQYIWAKDNGLTGDIQLNDAGDIAESFVPINTMDRDFYANEIEEAEKYKKKSFMELLEKAGPWVIVFLMFVMLLVNWDTIAQPALESQQQSLQMQQQNTILVKELQKTAAIIHGVQIPDDEETKPENGKG